MMPYRFLDIAATPSVRAAQVANGAGAAWAGFKGDREFARFTPDEAAFIAERDSFYMATVSETGWRGGERARPAPPPGFFGQRREHPGFVLPAQKDAGGAAGVVAEPPASLRDRRHEE